MAWKRLALTPAQQPAVCFPELACSVHRHHLCCSPLPAAVGQQDLLLQLLEDPEQRHQLRAFCAAYLGVQVSDALVTEADRFGFTLLGKPAAGEQRAPGPCLLPRLAAAALPSRL